MASDSAQKAKYNCVTENVMKLTKAMSNNRSLDPSLACSRDDDDEDDDEKSAAVSVAAVRGARGDLCHVVISICRRGRRLPSLEDDAEDPEKRRDLGLAGDDCRS